MQPVSAASPGASPALDNVLPLIQAKEMLSVRDIANRELLDLVPYEPGKPVDDVARELGLDPAVDHQAGLQREPARPFAARRH